MYTDFCNKDSVANITYAPTQTDVMLFLRLQTNSTTAYMQLYFTPYLYSTRWYFYVFSSQACQTGIEDQRVSSEAETTK